MNSLPEQLLKQFSEAGGRLRVRGALNPILWLCAIVTMPLLLATLISKPDPPPWVLAIAGGPVLAAIAGFLFLLIKDRDKLQSEDYQIRMHSLQLIQEKGNPFPINPTSIEAITNPALPLLPSSVPEEVTDL